MIVRQANEAEGRTPKLVLFALPIRWREGRITAKQVRSTGLSLFLLSAFFLTVAITSILGTSLMFQIAHRLSKFVQSIGGDISPFPIPETRSAFHPLAQ